MFVHSNVTGKMLLVYTAKGPQEVAESGPHPFGGVGMNFSKAIAILVPRPFMAAMIDSDMLTRKVVVALPLVSVDPRPRGGEFGDVAFERFAIGVVDHPQAHLSALPTNRADLRRTIIVIGSVSPVFVCPPARGIGRILMFFAFFPRILKQFIGLRHAIRQRLPGLILTLLPPLSNQLGDEPFSYS